MADEPVEFNEQESGIAEGMAIVDIESIPDTTRERVRARLLQMFTPQILRVKNAEGELMPYGIEVAECKICGSLQRQAVRPLLIHAGRHARERVALRKRR